jgi:DNA-directed RNA polymerase specialized sigma24 family protein
LEPLDELNREILLMWIGGTSVAEISRTSGMPAPHVNARIERAMLLLRLRRGRHASCPG